jgi:hypothetical protein
MHANILFAADENGTGGRKSEVEIAALFHVHPQTANTIRSQYTEYGLQAASNIVSQDPVPLVQVTL